VRNIYLVGFMGAGKSSIGRALADRLGLAFVDLDERLAVEFGMPIHEVFERCGEARFRDAERQALRWVTGLEATVVATGGGAFCSSVNRELIHGANGRSVFLDVPWEVVERRLSGDQSGRPKFVDVETARRLYSDRRPHYLQASCTVDLAGSESPRQAAERIVTVMAGAPCVT
jgi:shikimate kinase